MLYKTKTLNYRPFGVYDVVQAMLTADASDGVTFRVSCDNGKNWRAVKLNTPFVPMGADGRFVIEIKFPVETNSTGGTYTLNASGVFPLSVGATVYFTDGTNTFSTIIGPDGRYNVTLPRGLYKVWYREAGTKHVIVDEYNPEVFVYRQPDDLDKENTISMFLSHVDWATCAVYDTFKDASKVSDFSNAKIDLQQNLTDGSGKIVRYWALVFDSPTNTP
jgi:hypothetical protein